jgi:signal transduction histidine kinase
MYGAAAKSERKSMTMHDTTSSENLRDKTDQSLEDEREKTDEYLAVKIQTVEAQTSDTIQQIRVDADTARAQHRAAVDGRKDDDLAFLGGPSSPLDDQALVQERERADRTQMAERVQEDRARARERVQKRLIAEAVCEHERLETDGHLLDERDQVDLDCEQSSHLLSEEQHSHDATKAALVTRDQYLAIVSHDLKNSLVAMSLGTRVMRQGLSRESLDAASLLKQLAIIEQSTAGMDRMVTALLDVERMAQNKLSLTPERMELGALLQECADLFALVVANNSFTLTIRHMPEPLYVEGDHDRLLQVLANLLGNALKFTPKGGYIELAVNNRRTHAEISVRDNGPGVPPSAKDQIFERFSQLKLRDRRGLGLGLFIAKWIVEAHQGRIWVTSEQGRGSTFTFTLPLMPTVAM